VASILVAIERALNLNLFPMYEPITSEVTLRTGLVLKEIATGQLFTIGVRSHDGSDTWQLIESVDPGLSRIELMADRQTIAMKYLAEVQK
jgi:hypothetical protein